MGPFKKLGCFERDLEGRGRGKRQYAEEEHKIKRRDLALPVKDRVDP